MGRRGGSTPRASREIPSRAAELAADADEQSTRWDLPFVPRPEGGFANSPAFDLGHPCSNSLRAGYEAARGLIYGSVPSFAQCIGRCAQPPTYSEASGVRAACASEPPGAGIWAASGPQDVAKR